VKLNQGARTIGASRPKAGYGAAQFKGLKFSDHETVARCELALVMGGLLDKEVCRGLMLTARNSRVSARYNEE